ncbi:glutamate ABC transporter substrate-binding protein [Corynebacterium camporealensis]|uniref:glutamate ABC transporter substrate-binding protein n=1 Tax=Corynebacterium camporealensis TaxID=161896 RepID=UPI0034CED86B
MRRLLTTAASVAVCALTLSACAQETTNEPLLRPDNVDLNTDPGPPLPAGSHIEKAGTIDPAPRVDADIEGSYRPDDKTPKERVPDIVKRGRLVVGVDRSNNLLSYRDSATGEVRGFEVDLAHEIAEDIFGDRSKVDFRFVETSERIDALRSGAVDIVVRTMTISPERQREVAFSIPYMTTNTRMLVLNNSDIESIEDTRGATLCAVIGSTALDTIRRHAPEADILQTRSWGDCHMALQLNQVDGVVVDDALLSGMAQQDSYTSIVGEALETENYGVAVAKPTDDNDTRGLIRQVNSTLERIRTDGTWLELYDEWFGDYLTRSPLHAPVYLDEEADPDDTENTDDTGEAEES